MTIFPCGGPRADAARYLRRVRAAAHQMPGRVFTSYSAAVLLGLPIVGRWARAVYVLAGGPNGSRRGDVRYIGHRPDAPEVCVDGIRLTAPAYTVIQVARNATLAAGLVAADAALRQLQHRFWLPGLGEHARVDFCWPELGIAMEADGHRKYLDAGSGTCAAQRVVREKRREDEIRAQVEEFGRWDWDDAWRVYPLERKLERAGVPRSRPRRRLFVP